MLIRYEILRPSYRQLTKGLYASLWKKKKKSTQIAILPMFDNSACRENKTDERVFD